MPPCVVTVQVVRQLRGDAALDKFRGEFEKLHTALRKSHDGERRLMQKCRELNAELLANAAKVPVRGTRNGAGAVDSDGRRGR